MKWKLALITLLLSFSTFTYAETYTMEDLNKIATNLNKDYPAMVDKVTKLTNVTVDPSTFRYHYQLTSTTAADLDITKFEKLMRENLTKTVCADGFAQDVFKSNFNISFDYIDKDGKQVATILFKPADCPLPTTTAQPETKTQDATKASTTTTPTTTTTPAPAPTT